MSSAHSRSTASPRRGSWSPAPPASPARWRRRSSGTTRACELVAATSRSDAGKRLDQLYPRYRVPLELTELDLDAARGRRRGDRRLPARRRGADRRRAARPRASSSSTSPPTSGCATWTTYERWYGEHGAPELLRRARVYGLTELYRERAARGEAGRDPRLLPDRERARRWRRWPKQGLLADVFVAADAGHLRRRARRATTSSTSPR